MATTFASSVTNNALETANVSIDVSPNTNVVSATNMLPGDTAEGTLYVSNVGDTDVQYYVTADWKESGTTSARMARIVADTLTVSVMAGSPTIDTLLFNGILSDLIDQPSPGRDLALVSVAEGVTLTVGLPTTAGSVLQDLDLTVDFVFVAEGVSA